MNPSFIHCPFCYTGQELQVTREIQFRCGTVYKGTRFTSYKPFFTRSLKCIEVETRSLELLQVIKEKSSVKIPTVSRQNYQL